MTSDPTPDPTNGPQNGAERDRMAAAIMNRTGNTALATADALIAAGFGDVTALSLMTVGLVEQWRDALAERDALADNLSQANAMYAGVCVENLALAAQVAAVRKYLRQCRFMRMEPSTAGLTKALAATPTGSEQP